MDCPYLRPISLFFTKLHFWQTCHSLRSQSAPDALNNNFSANIKLLYAAQKFPRGTTVALIQGPLFPTNWAHFIFIRLENINGCVKILNMHVLVVHGWPESKIAWYVPYDRINRAQFEFSVPMSTEIATELAMHRESLHDTSTNYSDAEMHLILQAKR